MAVPQSEKNQITIEKQIDYSDLFQCCGNYDKLPANSSLNIDVSKLNFLNTCDVLILTQSVIFLLGKRPDVTITIENKNVTTRKYINDIGLISFCQTNYIQPKTIEFIESQTAMPILRIEKSSLEEYVLVTLQYIGRFCSNKDLTVLSLGIKESINNVYDHSKSDIGAYIFCQYYPKIKTIRVCVSDMGVGIPANVKKHKPEISSDIDCIKWAIKEHNTTKTLPSNAGLGLANIVSFVKETNGTMKLLSNSGQLRINGANEIFENNNINNFIGTLIEFDIKVDNLEEKEDSYIDDQTF